MQQYVHVHPKLPNYPFNPLHPGNHKFGQNTIFKICDLIGNQFNSVQSLSCVRFFVIPWIAARQASLPITNSWSLLKLKIIESVVQ